MGGWRYRQLRGVAVGVVGISFSPSFSSNPDKRRLSVGLCLELLCFLCRFEKERKNGDSCQGVWNGCGKPQSHVGSGACCSSLGSLLFFLCVCSFLLFPFILGFSLWSLSFLLPSSKASPFRSSRVGQEKEACPRRASGAPGTRRVRR